MSAPHHARMNQLARSAFDGTIAGIARTLSPRRSDEAAPVRGEATLQRCGAQRCGATIGSARCGAALGTVEVSAARCGSHDARCGSHDARCGGYEQRCGAQLGREAWESAGDRLVPVC